MEDNTIYYNAGFKSYDITKSSSAEDSWYEWVERSRYLMRRVKISSKVLRWLASVFTEASKIHENTVKRWKMKDHFSEFFCTLKCNENGRYISFIALQGQRKSIIITPESSHKGGWVNIAHKMVKILYEPEKIQEIQLTSTPKLTTSFKEACSNNRWTTEALKKAKLQTEVDNIRIIRGSSAVEMDLLSRCIVGKFQSTQEIPTLNDVRRWACNTWKTDVGVGVYAMNDGQFLFKLPSRKIAEHIQSGVWIWKKMKLELDWWNPTTGCWPEEIRRDWVWIRILGLPLSMWSNKMFKLIGDRCGGFVETEEETTLKNHLHWARIKVHGDGKEVPKEIELISDLQDSDLG